LDGGVYISAALDVTKHPETGRFNTGVRRLMVRGPRETGIDAVAPSDMRAYYRRARELGRRFEIAFVIGTHPLDYMATQMKVETDDEDNQGSECAEGVEAYLAAGRRPGRFVRIEEWRVPHEVQKRNAAEREFDAGASGRREDGEQHGRIAERVRPEHCQPPCSRVLRQHRHRAGSFGLPLHGRAQRRRECRIDPSRRTDHRQ